MKDRQAEILEAWRTELARLDAAQINFKQLKDEQQRVADEANALTKPYKARIDELQEQVVEAKEQLEAAQDDVRDAQFKLIEDFLTLLAEMQG